MTDDSGFKYDVAFSMVSGDEPVAQQIADLLSDRYRVFLYTERQRELAGTDGELTFKAVFEKESRFVIVLHRERWGQTSWTRMEEEAIRNRAYHQGYDFLKFIPLDEKPSLPAYVPKTHLWINVLRYGVQGAASAIETRLGELGASTRVENAVDRAARLARELRFREQKEAYFGSTKGVAQAGASFQAIADSLQTKITEIATRAPDLKLTMHREPSQAVVFGLGQNLRVFWKEKYTNSLQDARLYLELWRGRPPMNGPTNAFEQPARLKSKAYVFELQPDGVGRWLREKNPVTAVDAEAFADNALRFYMDQDRP